VQEQQDCFVCRKHRGEIPVPGGAIYEGELVYASHVLAPPDSGSFYLGYLIAETKRHAPGLADLTDQEAQAIGLLVTRLSRALKQEVGAEHVYSFVLGDAVPHLHVHVVPRYPGAPREYWGVRVDAWPEAPRGGPREVEDLCARLRLRLQV
jgi:histidine triad (HIT) family protein